MSLQAVIDDKTANVDERASCEAEYWQRYNRWHNLLNRLATAIAQLRGSDFMQSLREALRKHWSAGPLAPIEDLICLCLGKLDDQCVVYQLAVLVLLAQLLDIPHERCLIYDPVHTTEDRSILTHLGFVASDENKQAKYQVQRMTLFYMPFGPYDLYNNLVQANWHSLHRIAVLGNSFFWVCDSECGKATSAERIRRAPQVERVLPFIKATKLLEAVPVEQEKRMVRPTAQDVDDCDGFRHRRCSRRNSDDPWRDHLRCSLTTFPSASHSAIPWKAKGLPAAFLFTWAVSPFAWGVQIRRHIFSSDVDIISGFQTLHV